MIVRQSSYSSRRHDSLNSLESPTEPGHGRSRAAALLVGLCASPVVPEDAEHVQQRGREFFKTLKPQNHLHCWHVSQVALLSIRIDRSERSERRVRDKIAIRAELFWDDDRRLEASLLGEQLGNRPEVVVDQLRRTPHGCDWMIGRWAMLAHVADVKNGWTAGQTQLAFDLLGTPSDFREGFKPGALLDSDGHVIESSDDPARVARREIAALKERRGLVEGFDRANRALAMADLGDDADPELRRLRRHEATLHSRLRWCMNQIRYQSPLNEPYRGLREAWIGWDEPLPEVAEAAEDQVQAPSVPEPRAVVVPVVEEVTPGRRFPREHPPFDLEPDEYPAAGQSVDIPMILANRHQKKLRKEDTQRDAKRRKLERLRA